LFSKQFGLPLPTPSNFRSSTRAASSLPVIWMGAGGGARHRICACHGANAALYLVEAASDSLSSLLAAVDKASQLVAKAGGGQVSMSWGSAEFSGQTSFDSHFSTQNVVYLPQAAIAPARIGRRRRQMSSRLRSASRVQCRLSASYILHHGVKRAVASAVCAPSVLSNEHCRDCRDYACRSGYRRRRHPETGAWVYDSGNGGWYIVGGTSLASPTVAGITNASNSFASSTNAELTKIYRNKASNPSAFGSPARAIAGNTPPIRLRRRGTSVRASAHPSV